MITYPDGQEIRIGDSVLLDDGEHSGQIEALILSEQDLQNWDIAEPGLMVTSPYYGRVFISIDSLKDEGVSLVSRASA